VRSATLEGLLAARGAGAPVVLATDLSTGDEYLIRPHDAVHPETHSKELVAAAATALEADRSGVWETEQGRVFLHVYNTPVRVIIVGAVHIAQPLSAMVREAGFGITVVDPRAAFITEERFPGVALEPSWPAEALLKLRLDHRTAVVTVTHDPKLDDPALQAALQSSAFYIGALGSRRTHAKRIARLTEAGFEAADIARIHAPVGLDIGSRTPGEIATSVLAQIVKVLRTPGG
jgi:xanthine dehydrogenase accessory factor